MNQKTWPNEEDSERNLISIHGATLKDHWSHESGITERWMLGLSSPSPFDLTQDLSPGLMMPTLKAFLSQFTLLRNILWGEPRGISMVIMNPIKSIVRINYHNGICCSLKGDIILSLKIILCMLLSLIGYSCIGLFWSKSSLKKYLHIVFSHFYCIETRTVSPLEAPESMRQSVFLSQIASLYILCPSLCPG